MAPLGEDGGEVVEWVVLVEILKGDGGKELAKREPQAVAHEETSSDPGRRDFGDVCRDGSLQASNTNAGQQLGDEPDWPALSDAFEGNTDGKDEPVPIHGHLSAEWCGDEGKGRHADDLTDRHDGTPARENGRFEEEFAVSISGCCELVYETGVCDDGRVDAMSMLAKVEQGPRSLVGYSI